jgi:hypothetical protein
LPPGAQRSDTPSAVIRVAIRGPRLERPPTADRRPPTADRRPLTATADR